MALENKLELGIFIDILKKILGEILSTICFKSRFLGAFLAGKTPVNFLKWRFANKF